MTRPPGVTEEEWDDMHAVDDRGALPKAPSRGATLACTLGNMGGSATRTENVLEAALGAGASQAATAIELKEARLKYEADAEARRDADRRAERKDAEERRRDERADAAAANAHATARLAAEMEWRKVEREDAARIRREERQDAEARAAAAATAATNQMIMLLAAFAPRGGQPPAP